MQSKEAMMDEGTSTDHDATLPTPAAAYEHTVHGVNMGYEFILTLTYTILRALRKPELDILVVGAGGGAEIERFLPDNPGWRLSGVDPSQDMLDLAAAKADRLGVRDRVKLIRGTVDEAPSDPRFDAATCLFVLHFLPDDAKLALLRGMARRIHPGGPALIVSACRVDTLNQDTLRDDLLGAWQQYGEMHGMQAAHMAAIIDDVRARQTQATTEEGYRRLIHDAGFAHVANILSIMGNALCAWIAR
jgi:tRNA (cmo5U34)-methyltransferase